MIVDSSPRAYLSITQSTLFAHHQPKHYIWYSVYLPRSSLVKQTATPTGTTITFRLWEYSACNHYSLDIRKYKNKRINSHSILVMLAYISQMNDPYCLHNLDLVDIAGPFVVIKTRCNESTRCSPVAVRGPGHNLHISPGGLAHPLIEYKLSQGDLNAPNLQPANLSLSCCHTQQLSQNITTFSWSTYTSFRTRFYCEWPPLLISKTIYSK